MLRVVQSGDGAGFRSLIDEIVRDGARQVLAAALQAEVAAYVEQFADQVDENGRRLVLRNGYHQPRAGLTSAGAVEVKAPRMNDKRSDPETGERKRFSSARLPTSAHARPGPGGRRQRVGLLEGVARGLPVDERAALLVA
jgi:hypothetical protein